MLNLSYLLFGILSLSFLVFIHELGHFIMAKRVGMKVDVFSIGFGKSIFSWKWMGTVWQISIIPFGGYVKIAGTEQKGDTDPYKLKNGFYSKSPLQRIKVAIMGPVVNLFFAFLLFFVIWLMGGRSRPFEEVTNTIGWVDPNSDLSRKGVGPGDTIKTYGNKNFSGFKDLLYQGILRNDSIEISGEKIDYFTGEKRPYKYNMNTYPSPFSPDIKTIGVLSPASFLIFQADNLDSWQYSPAYGSGIDNGDRILWCNGEIIFSWQQLKQVVNQTSVYLSVDRKGKIVHTRVPYVRMGDLRILDQSVTNEFLDWKRHYNISGPLEDCFMLPYIVDDRGFVVNHIPFVDSDIMAEKMLTAYSMGGLDGDLQIGDRVVDLYGEKVGSGMDIFGKIQKKNVLLVVKKGSNFNLEDISSGVDWKELQNVVNSIGEDHTLSSDYKVLKPIVPLSYNQFLTKMGIEELNIDDTLFIFLGASVRDKWVNYNPSPIYMFKDVLAETWTTFYSLFEGNLNPKWLSGPIGLVKVIHDSSQSGLKSFMYWIAIISLNLGFVNLLPIPMLDGGHILFSVGEMVTGKKIPYHIMEKLIFPCAILLILLFVYITFQDFFRLFI